MAAETAPQAAAPPRKPPSRALVAARLEAFRELRTLWFVAGGTDEGFGAREARYRAELAEAARDAWP